MRAAARVIEPGGELPAGGWGGDKWGLKIGIGCQNNGSRCERSLKRGWLSGFATEMGVVKRDLEVVAQKKLSKEGKLSVHGFYGLKREVVA